MTTMSAQLKDDGARFDAIGRHTRSSWVRQCDDGCAGADPRRPDAERRDHGHARWPEIPDGND